jgi:hypothetical protein
MPGRSRRLRIGSKRNYLSGFTASSRVFMIGLRWCAEALKSLRSDAANWKSRLDYIKRISGIRQRHGPFVLMKSNGGGGEAAKVVISKF